MKVRIVSWNEGTESQQFFLFNVEGFVMHHPRYWKTRKGAINYAIKHGYTIVD